MEQTTSARLATTALRLSTRLSSWTQGLSLTAASQENLPKCQHGTRLPRLLREESCSSGAPASMVNLKNPDRSSYKMTLCSRASPLVVRSSYWLTSTARLWFGALIQTEKSALETFRSGAIQLFSTQLRTRKFLKSVLAAVLPLQSEK